jgi:transmembrane sensor
MLNQQEIDSIQRYLAGQANDRDTLWVENLFARGQASPGLQKLLKDDWNTITPVQGVNLDHLLDRVHHAIRIKELARRNTLVYRLVNTYSRVAAILLIPLLLAGIWFYLSPEAAPEQVAEQKVTSTIYAPMGSRVAFNLPDGTTGFLNSGSSLTYNIPFANNRQITLQGEAWFQVVEDASHPFEIGAGTSAVKVLGTSFNLSAYPDESYIEVVLAEGSLAFKATPNTHEILLKPLERLVYTGEKIHIEGTDPAKYSSWTEGKLIFRGDNMAEVARRLERWYNVKVEITHRELENYVFRATFEDDSLEEVLRLLCMTSPIRYRIVPRRALPDGTWSKEQVIMSKR